MKKKLAYIFVFIVVGMCGLRAQTDTIPKKDTTAINTPTITPVPTPTVTYKNPKKKTLHIKQPKIPFEKLNQDIAKLYKDTFDRKTEFVIDNKRYRIYNNYFSASIGKDYNSSWKEMDLCIGADYNFHVKKIGFQFGGNITGPQLWNNNNIEAHLGAGYRFERCNYMLAAYGGLSYTNGYYLQRTAIDTNKVQISVIGVYAALQAYYKVNFDYGLGVSLFFNKNEKQSMAGIKFEVFFSGAYKGFKRKNYAKEEEKYYNK